MARRRTPTRTFIAAAALMCAVVIAGNLLAGGLFNFALPFSETQTDHSPPLVLNEIRDLAEFRAAEAEFEVIVDRENDVRWVPAFVAGERVQFVAVGTVDATVDFSGLDDSSVIWDDESGAVTVVLPAPTIGDPSIDLEHSGVMNRDRGLLDRVGGVFSDNPTADIDLIREAEDKMGDAVTATDLEARARTNTIDMLNDLLGSAGVTEVRVVFESPAP